MSNRIFFGDNLEILATIADGSVDLIYIDPPFNTGKQQGKTQIKTVRSTTGDRVGFKGQTYATTKEATRMYADVFDDYLGFLEPRLREAHRILAPHGTLYFHIDYREVHYCKVLLDGIFGRASFLNEIIWAYDYGARTTKRWPAKHDNILVYVKNPERLHLRRRARSSAFRTWHPAWSDPKRPRAASCPPIPGGTPSCQRQARKRSATLPRSRWGFFGA